MLGYAEDQGIPARCREPEPGPGAAICSRAGRSGKWCPRGRWAGMGFIHEGPGEQAGDGGEGGRYRDGGITAPTYALRTALCPAATDPASPWRRRA